MTWSTPGLGVAPEGAEVARDGWRSALLKHCGRIVLLAGAPVIAYTVVTVDRHPIQMVAYGLVLASGAVAGFRRSAGEPVRGTLLIASCLFLGGVNAYLNGPTPSALLSLVSAPVLAGVAFGGRAGGFVLALSAAGFLVCGAAGRLDSTPRRARELVLFSTWPRMTAAYSVLTGLLVLLVSSAIRRSETGLADARAALGRALAERRERTHVEEALRESEERWRRISEATFEGIGFSEKGLMIDVNEQLAQMLGYGPDELIGMPVGNCTAPEDRLRVSQSIQSGNTGAYEHRALRKDGSTFPVEVRAKALTLHGRTVRVTAVRDLSERTRLEAELRRRETLATMGTLVAGVAHEVRTPLFSVSATLDTLDAGVGTPEEQQELKDLLRSQVRRLSVLMQDLLDYGRPPELKLAVGGLRPAVERVLRSCQPQATQSGVRIEVHLPDDLPAVRVDSGRLQQVLENLLVNAVQHAPRGSRVSIRARAVEQPLGLACDVEDEGPGLPAADLERVFEPFFGHRKGGTGMGLAIAQRFVEAHGGTLSAGNRTGGGAVFTLFLPAAEVPEDALA